MIRCARCGDRFHPRTPGQRHCLPCGIEVAALMVADAKRRAPRFPTSADLTGWVAA